MKYLLDTHTFIWVESEPEKLSPRAAALIRDIDNTLLLSVATIWEIQIKSQIGKLNLRLPLPQIVENQVQNNGLEILPIILPHALELDHLPLYHRDPFDRILIAQASIEKATLISNDSAFKAYPITVEW